MYKKAFPTQAYSSGPLVKMSLALCGKAENPGCMPSPTAQDSSIWGWRIQKIRVWVLNWLGFFFLITHTINFSIFLPVIFFAVKKLFLK